MRVQGKVKVRSKQRKHNLNSNNNLMGFDTIEINLSWIILSKPQPNLNYNLIGFDTIEINLVLVGF